MKKENLNIIIKKMQTWVVFCAATKGGEGTGWWNQALQCRKRWIGKTWRESGHLWVSLPMGGPSDGCWSYLLTSDSISATALAKLVFWLAIYRERERKMCHFVQVMPTWSHTFVYVTKTFQKTSNSWVKFKNGDWKYKSFFVLSLKETLVSISNPLEIVWLLPAWESTGRKHCGCFSDSHTNIFSKLPVFSLLVDAWLQTAFLGL